MLRKLCLALSLLLAGCAPVTAGPTPAPAAAVTPAPGPPAATAAAPTAVTATRPPATFAASTAAVTPRPQPGAASTSAVPAPPTAALLSAATPAGPGWQTFIAAGWPLAIDYPPDWQVQAQDGQVVFSSPDGSVVLTRVDTGGLAVGAYLSRQDLPNVRCQAGRNAAGVETHTCLDTIARRQIVYLATPPPVSAILALSAQFGRVRPGTLAAMVASARPAP